MLPHAQAAALGGVGQERPILFAAWCRGAFKRDIPRAVVRFFDTGHFALETHASEIAESIRDFLNLQSRNVGAGAGCSRAADGPFGGARHVHLSRYRLSD